MKLKQIGEFELIERMASIFGREPSGRVSSGGLAGLHTGIGDDAAVWAAPRSGFTIATTDAMVDGVHFTSQTTDWYDLGWKAMASNVSDIAGMGGIPRYGLAVLAAPGDLEVDSVIDLCRGMADMAAEFGTVVVGGDTVSSPTTTVSITLIGETLPGEAPSGPRTLSRFAAQPGDVLAVTGSLGSSAAGLEILLGNCPVPQIDVAPLLRAHRRPLPRVRQGQMLVEAGIRCGMDLSDGLAGDLVRICRASGVSAIIDADRVPMHPLLGDLFGDRGFELAISGGEDYELLCAGPAEMIEDARRMLETTGVPLTVVGMVVEPDSSRPPVMIRYKEGELLPPPRSGWEHFSSGKDAARS